MHKSIIIISLSMSIYQATGAEAWQADPEQKSTGSNKSNASTNTPIREAIEAALKTQVSGLHTRAPHMGTTDTASAVFALASIIDANNQRMEAEQASMRAEEIRLREISEQKRRRRERCNCLADCINTCTSIASLAISIYFATTKSKTA